MRGMPATLQLHVELWRRRDGWFDRMERSVDAARAAALRRLEARSGGSSARAPRRCSMRSLDSLEIALSRPDRAGDPRSSTACRRTAAATSWSTVTVKPLSVEDVQEVEGWLSGEVHDQGRAGFGVITQLPRSLFDAVRNFTGFGDSHDRAIRESSRSSSRPDDGPADARSSDW